MWVRTHAQNSFRLDRTSASSFPPPTRFIFLSFFFFHFSSPFPSLYSCPLVSVCGGITSRRNHGNHAAGAESVGMQALICRAIHKVIPSRRDEGGGISVKRVFSCVRNFWAPEIKRRGRSLEKIYLYHSKLYLSRIIVNSWMRLGKLLNVWNIGSLNSIIHKVKRVSF